MIEVSAEPLPPLGRLESLWRDLEARADGSFFTSWTWIGAWLSTFGGGGEIPAADLLVARAGGAVVGLAVVGRRRARSLVGSRYVLALHQSGHPDDDAIFIEYNDFLLDRAHDLAARRAMLSVLAARAGWRSDVRLNGVRPAVHRCAADAGLGRRVVAERVCPWVDLARVSPSLSGYLAVLSRNTRQQVQRSLRLYESEGPVAVAVARTPAQAAGMLDELKALHEKGWRERKEREGAFASARFSRFVARLAFEGIAGGDVQLLRVTAGGAAVGCLLNFIHRGHVYAYQSGFAYRDDNRYRPGLVTHALAVVHAREQGLLGYHFMAGEGRYKTSLSNADETLFWMMLRHDGFLSRAEDCARGVRSAIRAAVRPFRK